ncbi:MAG: alanine racemase [Anaerolineae bacterium]|nr:alanine racemase [Anaerolineae bacterium]
MLSGGQGGKTVTCIEVDLAAVRQNVARLREWVGPTVQVMAVVKANAYGHGAVPVARAALAAGASWLGVSRVAEGLELRQAGLQAPILVMTYALPEEMEQVAAHHLTPTLTEMEQVQALAVAAQRLGRIVSVHIKLDSGMGRAGVLPHEGLDFARAVAAQPALRLAGIYTHFAVADEPENGFTGEQLRVFIEAAEIIRTSTAPEALLHSANTGGTLYHRYSHLNMVRCGIGIYGLRPNAAVQPPFELRAALRISSHLGRVKTLPAGYSVGYGRTYVTPSERRIGLVPIGYGDGYPRTLSNRGMVLVGGKRVPVLGRVSMDQLSVDLSEVLDAKPGDEVVILGKQGREEISADEIALWSETINYEITTRLLARPPRIYQHEKP